VQLSTWRQPKESESKKGYVRDIDTANNFDVVNNQPTITRERVLRGGER
jgi:hypothetical protein